MSLRENDTSALDSPEGGATVAIMRVSKMALIGSIAFCLLFCTSTMAAQATVIEHPHSSVLVSDRARIQHFNASPGLDPNEEIPAYMGEAALASLIVLLGWFAMGQAGKRADNKRRLLLQLQSALKDFRELSLTVQLNQSRGHKIDEAAWPGLFAAKARVDAAADALPELSEARIAKNETSETLDKLGGPNTKARNFGDTS
jgi:hypothetical protein